MKNRNEILQTVCFSGRYYFKKVQPIYLQLEKEGLIKVVSDSDRSFLTATQLCTDTIRRAAQIPSLPENLSEEGFLIIRCIVNSLKANNRLTLPQLWDLLLTQFPGKYKTIREAVYYYNVSQIKSAL